jgi:hypothetical protein
MNKQCVFIALQTMIFLYLTSLVSVTWFHPAVRAGGINGGAFLAHVLPSINGTSQRFRNKFACLIAPLARTLKLSGDLYSWCFWNEDAIRLSADLKVRFQP